MLEGDTIRLRPWRDDDLPTLTELRNDIALQAQLLSRVRGSQPEQVRDWLKSRCDKTDRLFFVTAHRENDQACGFVQISDMNTIDGHAELGICLVSKSRGRGLGNQAIALVTGFLRDQWRLRKLYLRVSADNASALRCYEKAGFKHCGLLRQHIFIEGRWHDVVLMELFLVAED